MSMLDVEKMPSKIEGWLSSNAENANVDSYTIMTGGFSRVMARVELTWSSGKSETFILRGDPPPEIATMESDRDAEWELLSTLSTIDGISTPAARWYEENTSIFGTKAIFIDFVEGGSLQSAFDNGLNEEEALEPFIDLMASVKFVPLEELPSSMFRPDSWENHMDNLIDRWVHVADSHIESVPFVRHIAAWLSKRKPAPLPLGLVHGDFQQANIIAANEGWQLIDWEFSRIGDPREDLGYYAAYASSVPPSLIDSNPEKFLDCYRQKTGLGEEVINPITLGYFTVLSTIGTIGPLYTALTEMSLGKRHGIPVAYNSQLIPVGNRNFINAIEQLEAALETLEGG